MEAAHAAAAIANDKTARIKAIGVSELRPKNLYPIADLVTTADLSKKLSLIKEANEAAKTYSPKVVRVQVFFNDEVKYLAYANSEGRTAGHECRLHLTTGCIPRTARSDSSLRDGGAASRWNFKQEAQASQIARGAASRLNLRGGGGRGRRPSCCGPRRSAVLLHTVGHGLEPTSMKKL